jgi:proton-translocating NADH-quinone oxidoreductase chain M
VDKAPTCQRGLDRHNEEVWMANRILLLGVLLPKIVAALALVAWRKRLVRSAGYVAGAAAALSLIATLLLMPQICDGELSLSIPWIPASGISFALALDCLSAPFLLGEAVITALTMVYAWGYHHVDSRTPFFYALLLGFSLGMSGTVLADDMFLFYIFWEAMLIASATLILFWGEGKRRDATTLKYFLVTHLGSLAVLAGLITIYGASGNASISAMKPLAQLGIANPTFLLALFFCGFAVKMAIFPLHVWLPDTHTVAPMPVTIMLAASMLSMGTYGMVRFPLSMATPEAMMSLSVPLMVFGVISEAYGALMALAEHDIKRIIAYSSISQMGYILFGLGTLARDGIAGSILHVDFHGLAKALLFMCVGIVIRALGERDIRKLGGLGKTMPIAAGLIGVGALAIAATPPFAPFLSEWLIFRGGFASNHPWLTMVSVFGSLLTVGYALRFFGRIALGPIPEMPLDSQIPWAMLVPAVVMAALVLLVGLWPDPLFQIAMNSCCRVLGGTP